MARTGGWQTCGLPFEQRRSAVSCFRCDRMSVSFCSSLRLNVRSGCRTFNRKLEQNETLNTGRIGSTRQRCGRCSNGRAGRFASPPVRPYLINLTAESPGCAQVLVREASECQDDVGMHWIAAATGRRIAWGAAELGMLVAGA